MPTVRRGGEGARGKIAGSFRDPSGYVFRENGGLFRQITQAGQNDFEAFINSGLADKLLDDEAVVPFTFSGRKEMVLILEELPFITYPYEWSFSQLRDGALLTLEIIAEALKRGLVLKDASAFNIAFRKGRPVFIDHTSFTVYRENEPWCAYRQFIMHFLAPLLLMRKCDLRCLGLFRNDIGGIPLELASRLLPRTTWLSPEILIHVHLHALFERHVSEARDAARKAELKPNQLENMVSSLHSFIAGMRFPGQRTAWAAYSGSTSYNDESFRFKQACVDSFCRECAPKVCVDLGANNGIFSETVSKYAAVTVAADIDPCAVEQLYRLSREKCPGIIPVLLDLNNPSPGLGVFNGERLSFFDRFRGDLVLGLALIHHLRISGNWSLEQIAELFARMAPRALTEFVPREDPQVKQLLRGRKDYCTDWTLEKMCAAFRRRFARCETIPIPGSVRTLIRLSR